MEGKCNKFFLSALALSVCISAMAEDNDDSKVSLEVGADVVSSYVWRGMDCGGFSVQPGATLTFNRAGISIGAWASASLFETTDFANMAEFDLSLSYAPTDAFSIGVTDYNFCGGNYWRNWTFNGVSTHSLELNVSYDFGALAVEWDTCLTGEDHRAGGKRAYSSYFQVSAPFSLGGVDCSTAIGACPWGYKFGADYGHGFSVINVSLKAEKEVKSLPLFGEIVFNPREESTYFVVGVSF